MGGVWLVVRTPQTQPSCPEIRRLFLTTLQDVLSMCSSSMMITSPTLMFGRFCLS